jgi:hypothetical protein
MAKYRSAKADKDGVCGEVPPWINAPAEDVAPRLRCVRQGKHKRHQDARDHTWDVVGRTYKRKAPK